MGSVIFRCPVLGISVQGWIAQDASTNETDGDFIGIKCAACSQVHLVNAATGKVLGEGRAQNRDD